MRKMILSVIGVIALAVCGFASPATYCVIDLSGGANAASYPVAYLDSVPIGGWSDEYKTTKLVLRYIAPGSFNMGGTPATGRTSRSTTASSTDGRTRKLLPCAFERVTGIIG